MKSTFKILTILLTILMVLAPISSVVAGSSMAHADLSDSLKNMQFEMHNYNSITVTHHHQQISNINQIEKDQSAGGSSDVNTCQDKCANCFFCSASTVTSSYFTFTVQNASNPENLKIFSNSINISVDLRPPRSISQKI